MDKWTEADRRRRGRYKRGRNEEGSNEIEGSSEVQERKKLGRNRLVQERKQLDIAEEVARYKKERQQSLGDEVGR